MRFAVLAVLAAAASVTARPTLNKSKLFARTATVCVNLDSDCQKGASLTEACCVGALYASGGSVTDTSCLAAFNDNITKCHLAGNKADACTTEECCIDMFNEYTGTTTAAAILEHETCTSATSAQLKAYKKAVGQ